jgi:hypothetical protein
MSNNTANLPRFQQVQTAFTAYLRDPTHHPPPSDVEARRLAVYRRLFYNNVQSLLANTYRVVHKILPREQWHTLIKDYFAKHRATIPLFPQMPQELLRYLETECELLSQYPPFLTELAHYEWVELAISIDTREIELTNIDRTGDLLQHPPVLNPIIWPLTYQYPVHQISPDYQPTELPAENTYIVIYRNLADEVGFLQLNNVSAYLLKQLLEAPQARSGREVLTDIANTLQHPNPEKVIAGGLEILQEWLKRDIVLGVSF